MFGIPSKWIIWEAIMICMYKVILCYCVIFSKNVRGTFLKTYVLYPTNFHSAPELAWFAVVKRKILN